MTKCGENPFSPVCGVFRFFARMKAWILLFLTAATGAVLGQTPTDSTRKASPDSVKTLPATAAPSDTIPLGKLTYSLGLEGDFRRGNLQRDLYTVRLAFEFVPKRAWLGFYSSPRYSYGKTAGQLQEDELFVDLNATAFYNRNDVYGLAFGVLERSNLRQINRRLYGGAGVGWRITGGLRDPDARLKVAVTNALLYENTDFIEKPGEVTRDVNVVRNSTRLRVTASWLDGRFTLASTTFFQPALNRPNLRANAVTQALIQLTKRLAFSLTLENSYESVVAVGRQNADHRLTFGLTMRSL